MTKVSCIPNKSDTKLNNIMKKDIRDDGNILNSHSLNLREKKYTKRKWRNTNRSRERTWINDAIYQEEIILVGPYIVKIAMFEKKKIAMFAHKFNTIQMKAVL